MPHPKHRRDEPALLSDLAGPDARDRRQVGVEALDFVVAGRSRTAEDEQAIPAISRLPSEQVVRRIGRVATAAPALAGAMAVLGDGAPLPVAAAVAGISVVDAARLARRLVQIEVLARDDPFAFVHPVVRRSVYDTLTSAERTAAHGAAADLLRGAGASAQTVAYHLGAREPAGSAEAANDLATILGGAGAAGFLIATGAAVVRGAPLPRWLGWVGVVLGVDSLALPFAAPGPIGLWTLIACITLLVRRAAAVPASQVTEGPRPVDVEPTSGRPQ
jgi:hypothetical protein